MAYEVKEATWEEFAEGELTRKVVAEIGPRSLLIAVSDMVQGWNDYAFYKEGEYEELLRELERTGNWDWIRWLEEFKFNLRCAEEPIGYFVFWQGNEVVDIIVVVAFLEELTANLIAYSVGSIMGR